ncbi:MAG: PrsW family intramembrane metalloprotease [Candidatus Poseidoniia archaeon]|nr:PrsW family intramembrane metalloprotease [Candidatus Poseidoniia archaeon]
MANMLLIMGGQLAYLYIVGPISMDDGRPMTLPEIPFLGLLIIILITAGGLTTAAILQRKPAPIRYVSVNSKPYTRQVERNENSSESQQYRPTYPGQYSAKTGNLHYNKSEEKEDLNWKEEEVQLEETITKKLGSFEKHELQLPNSGILFFGFLLSLALGIAVLGERGPFLYLFPIAFLVAFSFPGLIWVSYIYSRTITSPEPQRLILIALAWGMFSTLPASLLNDLGARIVNVDQNALFGNGEFGTPELVLVSVIAPFVEELLKPIGLIFVIKRLRTPYEGVLYGVACGMGFAIIENMLYELFILIWYGSDAWTLNAFVRGIGSTVLHAVGPAAIGYAVAFSNQMQKPMRNYLILAYLFGFTMHALWNGFATMPLMLEGQFWEYTSYVLIVIMIALCLAFIIKALEYGKEYANLELKANDFGDLEEEATNSGH